MFPATKSAVRGLGLSLSLSLAALFSGAAGAAAPFVFGTFNQGALARFAPLPVPQADRVDSGARVSVDWTNESVIEARGDESLRLDGEALRLGVELRRRFGGWQFSAELPLLATGGGSLDALIENWHGWFGLPNGGRETLPRNDYRYQYLRGGQTRLDLGDARSGIGDLRAGAAYCGDQSCWRTMLQLPSGDAEHLLGGGLGLAVWYERGYAFGADRRWSGALAAGAAAVRAAGPLESQQRRFLPFGWASIGYALSDGLDAGVQFYLHSPLYRDSELDALSQSGGQLAFGFRYRSSAQVSWWLGMQEDLITESSPDLALHFCADWP